MYALWYVALAAAMQTGGTPRDTSPERSIRQLGFLSLATTGDGRFLAYVRQDKQDLARSELWVHDVERGTSQRVTADAISDRIGPRPVWSSDGRFLAYYGYPHVSGHLRVWDRIEGRRIYESEASACSSALCGLWYPQWTPDARFILFVADTGRSRVGEANGSPWRRLADELIGITPAPSGETVLESPALNVQAAAAGPAPRAGAILFPPTQILAFDVRTGTTRVVASGAPFVGLELSADGRVAIAVVWDSSKPGEPPHNVYSLYRLPRALETAVPPPSDVTRSEPATPVDALGAPLRLLASRFPNWQVGRSVSLAPSGRFLAYTTTGPTATGDVFVVDVERGTTRNLTADVQLSLNPLDADRDTSLQNRRFDWRGKFGSSYFAPVWTADERAVLVMRPVARRSQRVPMRFELWTVPREGGTAQRVPIDTAASILAVAHCAKRQLPCVVGSAGEVLTKVRRLQDNTLAYAALNPRSGAMRVLRVIGPAGRSERSEQYNVSASLGDFLVADDTKLVSVEETHERPPELWRLDLAQDIPKARSLDVLNPRPLPAFGTLQRVEWVTATGDTLGAVLRFPVGVRDRQRVPAIMVVYPGRDGTDFGEFDGTPAWYTPLLTGGHFAVITPDLPLLGPGQGHACDEYAQHAVEALEAAIKTGRIDETRVGVMGHSFGGWTVNCLITRTTRFRAAVSSAGISDLTSYSAWHRNTWGSYLKLYAPPYEAPQEYVNESPVYHVDKVRTPLLLVYGKRDEPMFYQQAKEMYDALLSLNQPVALVAYDGKDHITVATHPRYWERVVGWFARHFGIDTTSSLGAGTTNRKPPRHGSSRKTR